MDYSTSSLNDDSNHPDSGQNNEKMSGIRIIEILLQYFRDLPTGFSPSIVRQILQILKHLAKFLKETIIDLLLDGSITSKLSICSYEILIDFIQLLKLVRDSPRFAQAITTPLSIDANVIETSTLSIINKTITDQIEISPISKPINGLTRFLFRFLYETYQLGLLPASILFEPGLLRMIARRMSEIVTDAKIELKQEILSDFQVYTMIMHRVTVSEKAPIVRILIREVFSLMAAVSKLSRNSEFAMMKKSNVEFNEIFNSLHSALDTIATELHSGKYNARPIPIFRTRERRLTIDEELQIYNQIFSQSI